MGIGPGMLKLQLTIAEAVRDRLNALAAEQGMTKSQYLTMLINREWKEVNRAAGGNAAD